jgi:outer membrane receptor protein involved in Fe transport
LTVSAGFGRYSQLPSFDYTDPNLGNPALSYLLADHYVLGVDAVVARGYVGRFNVFYKSIDDLVTSDPVIRYDNLGEGRAWGAEFMLRKGLGKLTGWVSLTWSRSFRTDTSTGLTSPFEFDQPLSVSVVAKYDLSEKVSLSGRAAFHSGAPVTPIYGGQPNPDRPDGYLPEYGPLNSDRLPAYFRADLRLDWYTGWRNTTLYFEMINATGRENVLGYEYNIDYSERKIIEQLPMFVSFGVKKRW